MCSWVWGWHALVQTTAPGEPFSGGYSSPQNGRGISELALRADAPQLPASAPFVITASLIRPLPVAHQITDTTGATRAASGFPSAASVCRATTGPPYDVP